MRPIAIDGQIETLPASFAETPHYGPYNDWEFSTFSTSSLNEGGGRRVSSGTEQLEMTMLKLAIATAVLLSGTAVAAAAPRHFAGAEFLPQAKVTLAQARQSAVRAHPGVITDQELEKERGGTGLRYSFDIKSQGKTFEVGIDARTGKVLENKAEGANPD